MRENLIAVSTPMLVGWWGAFFLSLFLVGFAVFVIPQFDSVFAQFGADLPALTRWVIECRWFTLILPWAVLAPLILVSVNGELAARTHRYILLLLAAILLVLFSTAAAMLFAVYLPIIRMGALV